MQGVKALRLEAGNSIGPGLAHLAQMPSLRRLDLHGSYVTDSHLQYLVNAKNIKELELEGTVLDWREIINLISDDGLVYLGRMTQLEVLKLDGQAITTLGMKHLLPLENLRELNLELTSVGYHGVPAFGSKPKLEKLQLSGITRETLSEIVKLSSLRELEFGGNRCDDAVLVLLARMPNLERLRIEDYWMPTDALAYVRALPEMPAREQIVYALVRALAWARSDEDSLRGSLRQAEALALTVGLGQGELDAAESRLRFGEFMMELQNDRATIQNHIPRIAKEAYQQAKAAFGTDSPRFEKVKKAVEEYSGLKFTEADPPLTNR